jgi:predicted helicase
MDKAERGVVGIITNHRFLTNPTFRGMRQSLMKTFDHIYFIDLHGSNKPKEFAPDGGRDENVFDIEQGVAISVFIKRKGLDKKIFHADFWGKRLEKYQKSLVEDLQSIEWKEVKATTPFYLFTPQNEELKTNYSKFYALNDIFLKNSLGIFTHRDYFLVDANSSELKNRITKFKNSEDAYSVKNSFGLKDTRDWKIETALKEIKKNEIVIEEYSYRPFDKRNICYNIEMFDRGCSRFELMNSFLNSKNNLGLITGRAGQNVTPHLSWNLGFMTSNLTDANLFSRGGACVFPLFLLLNRNNPLFAAEPVVKYGKKVIQTDDFEFVENFTKTFRDYIFSRYNHHFFPEEILGYIYAILYSPAYRSKYAGFLKIDFPRIPFVDDTKQFKKLTEVGYQLICTHIGLDWLKPEGSLLSREVHPEPDLVSKDKRRLGDYMGEEGDNRVEKIEFLEYPADRVNPFERVFKKADLGIVKINKHNFFDLVPIECWEFQIGGYAVLPHFLKDRKGKILSLDELEMFEKTVIILYYTIQKMKEIDKLTKNWI